MATKIKRGGKGVRRAAKSQSRRAGARRAKAKTTGFVDSAMGVLPFTEEQWSRIFLAIIIGGAVALAWVIANLAGVPAMAQTEVARIASDAGFEVKQVRVTGTERLNERQVYDIAFAREDQPMTQVDIEQLRSDLLELSWVKDARVSLQLPDTLAVDIVERTPHAVLERPDKLMLIDASGVELEAIKPEKSGDMLRISGAGSAKQVAELEKLLATAPALRPQVEAAQWLGNRRWNLTFKTGQVLALPEGGKQSAEALVKFARLDGQNRLLGGQVATFDMRVPERIFMRVPGSGDTQGKAGNP
ncbi:MAG: FtsQ-type POTRA domain-containing protein [Pseudomonadota bacterium]